MPARAELVALAAELRNARTSLLPLDMAERVQHTIVRIEQTLEPPVVDPVAADALSRDARQLLDDCEAFLRKIYPQ